MVGGGTGEQLAGCCWLVERLFCEKEGEREIEDDSMGLPIDLVGKDFARKQMVGDSVSLEVWKTVGVHLALQATTRSRHIYGV